MSHTKMTRTGKNFKIYYPNFIKSLYIIRSLNFKLRRFGLAITVCYVDPVMPRLCDNGGGPLMNGLTGDTLAPIEALLTGNGTTGGYKYLPPGALRSFLITTC